MAKVVELQRYPNSATAHLVQGRLAQDGIQAWVRRGSRYQAMGGSGYVVSVLPEHLERARQIIDRTNAKVDLDEYVDPNNTAFRRCPQCRSVMVQRQPLQGWPRRLVFATLGVGLFFVTKSFRCDKCGHRWDAR